MAVAKKKPIVQPKQSVAKAAINTDGFAHKLFPHQKSPKDAYYFFSFFILYILVAFVGIANHEMWRDELEPWLIGSNSKTMAEFFHNMKMGSNPYIWYLTLHLLSFITLNPVIVQIAHITIAIAAIYLLLRYSPFTILQKFLFCLGYYFLFEYAIISRGYSLTIFFLFLFCTLFRNYWNKTWPLAIVIFLLANATGGFGAILSISILLLLGANYVFNEMSEKGKRESFGFFMLSFAIILFGIWVAIKSIHPPEDSVYNTVWFLKFDMNRVFQIMLRLVSGYIPIPVISNAFWNTNLLVNRDMSTPPDFLTTLLAILILVYGILLFSRKISVLLFYLSGTLGILLFSYTNPSIFVLNGARYNGFLFVLFILSLWLLSSFPEKAANIPSLSALRNTLKIEKIKKPVLTVVLSLNVIAGLIAYSKDFSHPFSSVEKAGKYIVSNHLENMTTAGFTDYAVSPITAYTQHPVYYPDRDTTSTFPIWRLLHYSMDMNITGGRFLNYIKRQKDSVLVILNFDLNTDRIDSVTFSHLASFKGAIVGDENFSIYIAQKIH